MQNIHQCLGSSSKEHRLNKLEVGGSSPSQGPNFQRVGSSIGQSACCRQGDTGSIPGPRANLCAVSSVDRSIKAALPARNASTDAEPSTGVKPVLIAASHEGAASERWCEKPEAGGSNPSPRPISKIRAFQFRFREGLGRPECPYAFRTILNLGAFSLRVHEWIRSDDKRYMHDHPWSFLTIVLRGSYTDVSAKGRDVLRAGSIRFRRATHRHYVEVPAGGAVSFLITGPKVRDWGFWVKGVLKRPLRYFGRFGHPPCSEQ